jgi:hypothetical protein
MLQALQAVNFSRAMALGILLLYLLGLPEFIQMYLVDQRYIPFLVFPLVIQPTSRNYLFS